jgi:hypothetical protein
MVPGSGRTPSCGGPWRRCISAQRSPRSTALLSLPLWCRSLMIRASRKVTVPVLVSALYLACAITHLTAGEMSEEFGPRRILRVGIELVLAGGASQDLATSIVSRVVIGVGKSARYPLPMVLVFRRATRGRDRCRPSPPATGGTHKVEQKFLTHEGFMTQIARTQPPIGPAHRDALRPTTAPQCGASPGLTQGCPVEPGNRGEPARYEGGAD